MIKGERGGDNRESVKRLNNVLKSLKYHHMDKGKGHGKGALVKILSIPGKGEGEVNTWTHATTLNKPALRRVQGGGFQHICVNKVVGSICVDGW